MKNSEEKKGDLHDYKPFSSTFLHTHDIIFYVLCRQLQKKVNMRGECLSNGARGLAGLMPLELEILQWRNITFTENESCAW